MKIIIIYVRDKKDEKMKKKDSHILCSRFRNEKKQEKLKFD
jgi:hypothetical protein